MPTTLLRNGSVYSPADPFATAMLVDGDRVAWVGSEGAAAAHADDVDTVVDLDGALVTPAFVDAHVHLSQTGLGQTSVDLTGATSLATALDALAAAARRRPDGVLLALGWDEEGWPEGRPFTAAEVEAAAPGRVVYAARVDGHCAVVSQTLLQREPGITAAAGYHPDGRVERAAHHAARAAAGDLVTPDQRREAMRRALRLAAAQGVGCVHEMSAPHVNPAEDLDDLAALTAGEALPGVVTYWGEAGVVDRARALGVAGLAGDLCLDGSLGSRTAHLSQPYADAAGSLGHGYLDLAAASAHVVACTRAGLQAGFHAIGDAAVRLGVAAVAHAAEVCGDAAVVAARHRLEHVELLPADLVPELVRLGVVASVQPAFDARWGGADGMYARRLGVDRAATMNAFAAMSRAGVTLALGSDAPVTPIDPWAGVRAAAFHHTPAARLSVRSAFSAHTRGGWRAARVDDAGVLAPGMLASFAVWEVPGELVVQAADERVARWSTDPRSGVPGLPDLTPGVPLPRCRQTVAAGVVVHGAW